MQWSLNLQRTTRRNDDDKLERRETNNRNRKAKPRDKRNWSHARKLKEQRHVYS